MATKGSMEKNKRRKEMASSCEKKRARLKALSRDKDLAPDQRFAAMIKLSEMPRNSSKVRVRNRCFITGRARGYYRKFGISRIMIRELAASGVLPGVTKASW